MKLIYKIRVIVLMFIVVMSLKTNAQDVHLSQFYSSPSMLNPSMTGMMSEVFRSSISYRSQWSSVVPYSTMSASMERSISLDRYDRAGIGLVMFNDKTGAQGGLNTFKCYLGGSYQKVLRTSNGGVMLMGFGGQLGFAQKSLYGVFDYSEGFSESFQDNSTNYLDFNSGAILVHKSRDKNAFFIGGSVFHLNQPRENFSSSNNDWLAARWVLHGGAILGNAKKPLFVTPNFVVMRQGGAQEINIGGNIHYDFYRVSPHEVELMVGGWVRLDDALIAYMGLRFDTYELGFSYDVNTSGMKTAVNGRGALEFNFKYFIKDKHIKLLACPSLRM